MTSFSCKQKSKKTTSVVSKLDPRFREDEGRSVPANDEQVSGWFDFMGIKPKSYHFPWLRTRPHGIATGTCSQFPGDTAGSDTDAIEVLNISKPQQRKIPSKSWRECIKKVWEADPLECPECGREMKIINFVDGRLLTRHILEHLDPW